MKLKSEVTWAALVITTAAASFYLGLKTGSLETEENLNIAIEKKDEQITALEQKIHQLSDELTSRGIYSYPQASVVAEKSDTNATVLINLNGREAIDNLEIERKTTADYSSTINEETGGTSPRGKRASVGTLSAHNPVVFELEQFENELAIDLNFKSNGNLWHQYIRVKKMPKGEIKTFWVITNREGEVIDKHIDEGFPVDNGGNIVFGANEKLKYSDVRMNSIFRPYSAEKSGLE